MATNLLTDSVETIISEFNLQLEVVELLKSLPAGASENIAWEGVIIIPSAKSPGNFQAQYFNQRGFLSEEIFPDIVTAVESSVGLGYLQPAKGLLKRCLDSGRFVV